MVTDMAAESLPPTPPLVAKAIIVMDGFSWGWAAIRRLPAIDGVMEVARWLFLCERVESGCDSIVWASRHAHGPTTGGSHVCCNNFMGIFSENIDKCQVTVTGDT